MVVSCGNEEWKIMNKKKLTYLCGAGKSTMSSRSYESKEKKCIYTKNKIIVTLTHYTIYECLTQVIYPT